MRFDACGIRCTIPEEMKCLLSSVQSPIEEGSEIPRIEDNHIKVASKDWKVLCLPAAKEAEC